MGQFYCQICKKEFNDDQYDLHVKPHVGLLPVDDSNFIPEVEIDDSGKIKPRPYQQKPYEPLTDFGG
jgi:hypothetical protein